jgi:hypothetical protein
MLDAEYTHPKVTLGDSMNMPLHFSGGKENHLNSLLSSGMELH